MHKKRILTSAPALSFAVISLVAGAWLIEHQMRNNNESLMAFVLSSDDGREFDAQLTSALPDSVAAGLTEMVIAAPVGSLSPGYLDETGGLQSLSPDARKARTAFVGRMLSARNRFSEARILLETLSADERNLYEAAFAYAEALKGLGEDEGAITAYELLLSGNPNHEAGHINFAILLMRLDQHEAAAPVLQRAVEITSSSRRGKAYSLQGISATERGDYRAAVEFFQQSIAFRASHAPTWRRLAIAQARSGAFEQDAVIASFEQARALSPGSSLNETAIAEYFFSVGRFDDALAPYRAASQSAQHQDEILLNRALNLILSERPSAARDVVRSLRALDLGPVEEAQADLLHALLNQSASSLMRHLEVNIDAMSGDDRALFLQLLGHLDIDDFETARAYADRISTASVYSQPARFSLARYLYREGRSEDALGILAELVSANAHSPIIWLYLGRSQTDPAASLVAHQTAYELLPRSGRMTIEYAQALTLVDRSEEAIAILFGFLDLNPNEPRALRALARIFDTDGQLDRAEQIYRILYDLNTSDADIGEALADVQFRASRFETALETMDRLIELQPSQVVMRQRRAETLVRLNRVQAARLEYERILRLDPSNEIAHTALAAQAG